MNKTANYQLNRWEKTDKVLMDDFNADNEKIDAAIAKCGNCRVRVSTYVGDGTGTRIHTFERKPVLMIAMGYASILMMCPGHTSPGIEAPDNRVTTFTWKENNVTIKSGYGDSALGICNTANQSYTLIIFEDTGKD